ncbi:hypothetical protein CEXT_324661 [Caerostris extrusa]|uniref:Secreted protein n=1 Tax=Caerostris extrusa TaxID=172846 RepID=A0AAV4R1U1_CAEEX|nr:hypothetical protein CEXT_324661 [Caerostris extrusa]
MLRIRFYPLALPFQIITIPSTASVWLPQNRIQTGGLTKTFSAMAVSCLVMLNLSAQYGKWGLCNDQNSETHFLYNPPIVESPERTMRCYYSL